MRTHHRMAGLVAGIGAMIAGSLAFGSLARADEPEPTTQTSLVEDFTHPDAAGILARDGLKVYRGDGHIIFSERKNADVDGQCAATEIQVEEGIAVEPYGWLFCFRTIGTEGYLTLEVPGTYGVRAGTSTSVRATAETPEGTKTYDVPANRPVPIYPGTGDELPQAVLVELRLTGA